MNCRSPSDAPTTTGTSRFRAASKTAFNVTRSEILKWPHAARLFDGRAVVLKVRKPCVEELVQIDLEILAGLIDEWSPRFPVLEQYDARLASRRAPLAEL